MAGPLWLAWLFPVMAMGCVWPVDINERDEVDIAPVLDRALVDPNPEETVRLPSGGTTTFSVDGAISDVDDDVATLEYDWWLNFTAWCDDGQCKGKFLDGIGRSTVSFNQCSPYPQTFLKKFGEGPHILELFVSEQGVNFDPDTGQRTVDGTYAYVTWTLETVPCTQ